MPEQSEWQVTQKVGGGVRAAEPMAQFIQALTVYTFAGWQIFYHSFDGFLPLKGLDCTRHRGGPETRVGLPGLP